MDRPDLIREVTQQIDPKGRIKKVRIVFGPHYFLEIERQQGGKLAFRLGATHHGFEADASEVGGQLDSIVEDVRARFPDRTID